MPGPSVSSSEDELHIALGDGMSMVQSEGKSSLTGIDIDIEGGTVAYLPWSLWHKDQTVN
jgi:hypothetical protein